MGDTHITGRHFGGDTHITSDMCVGIHISRGYTYHCDTGSSGDSTFLFFRGVEVLLKAMTTILRGGQKQLLWVMIQYICLPLPISMLASLCGRYDKKVR